MKKNWIVNGLGVLILVISLFISGAVYVLEEVPFVLLVIHFSLVLLLILIGRFNPVIQQTLSSFFKPSVQLVHFLIIGSISSFFSIEIVAALIPEDPFLFSNALLTSILLSSVYLWLFIIYFLLVSLYLFVGYEILFSKEKKTTSQKMVNKIAIFAGLGIGIVFGYNSFLFYASDSYNTFGSRLIVHSQFHKNKRCINLPKDIEISSVSNNEVLEFIDNLDNTFDYKRHKCTLIRDTTLDNWSKT